MEQQLRKIIEKFLRAKGVTIETSLLLALSGGYDSLALLYLLLAVRKTLPFALHIAHINHNWRPESLQEAQQLQKMANDYKIPFYLKELDPILFKEKKGNAEEIARQERLHFFKEICKKWQCEAVLTAHHSDDQAETILKRIFEGASILNLQGIQEVITVDNLTLWRPLLSIRKSYLVDYTKQLGLQPFDDTTNRDPRYLRSRMRTALIPSLEQTFGKSVSSNLCRLGSSISELSHFLDSFLEVAEKQIQAGIWGLYLDFNKLASVYKTSFITKLLIRSLCEKGGGIAPSNAIVETAAAKLLSHGADCSFHFNNSSLIVDRGYIFFIPSSIPKLSDEIVSLEIGKKIIYEPWEVSLQEQSIEDKVIAFQGWQAVWLGRITLQLPDNQLYTIGCPKTNQSYPGKNPLRDHWNKHKVPAFIRNLCPVVYSQGEIVAEFLSGGYKYNSCSKKVLLLQLKNDHPDKDKSLEFSC